MKLKLNLKPVVQVVTLLSFLNFAACSSKGTSFSLLPDTQNFAQNAAATNGKIDILWVIDNSGSMASSQTNIASNFASFMRAFSSKGYDYQMAVTTTDAYMELFGAGSAQSQFRDGTDATSHTGIYVIDPQTPNSENVFITNIEQGINGSGDERAFQSLKQTLNNPLNSTMARPFPRADAFLAVIIVSDEDDFSWDGASSIAGQYSNAGLHSVDSYVSDLDQLTGATAATRSAHYNVSSISIQDQTCLAELNQQFSGRILGARYKDISQKTNGTIGSLCDDFGATLANISNKIVELNTQFFLSRVPDVSTITVQINGVTAPSLTSASPQPWNGYIYHSDTNSITFHGSFVPGPASTISVHFDPTTLR